MTVTLNNRIEAPLLAHAFGIELPHPLAELRSPDSLLALLDTNASPSLERPENIKTLIRDVLRIGGFKPNGRNKPASEYLVGAQAAGRLQPINPIVDACNVISLHSGIPISVVDLDRTEGTLSIEMGEKSTEYVFNQSGQVIQIEGLTCLFDAVGPCANAVKDSQRTKTQATTCRVLTVMWSHQRLSEHTETTANWYRELLLSLGYELVEVEMA